MFHSPSLPFCGQWQLLSEKLSLNGICGVVQPNQARWCSLCAHRQNGMRPFSPHPQKTGWYPNCKCNFEACGLYPPSRTWCYVQIPSWECYGEVYPQSGYVTLGRIVDQHRDIALPPEPGCQGFTLMRSLGTTDTPVLRRHNHRGWDPAPSRSLGF